MGAPLHRRLFHAVLSKSPSDPFCHSFSRMNFIQAAHADKIKVEGEKPTPEVKPYSALAPAHPSHAAAVHQAQPGMTPRQQIHPLAQSILAQPISAPSPSVNIAMQQPMKGANKRTYEDVGSPAESSAAAPKKKVGRPAKGKEAASPPVDPPPKKKPGRQPKTKKQSSADVIQIPAAVNVPSLQPPPLLPVDPAQVEASLPQPIQPVLPMFNPILNGMQQMAPQPMMQPPPRSGPQGVPTQINYQALQAAMQQQGISSMPNLQSHPALMQFAAFPPQMQQQLMMAAGNLQGQVPGMPPAQWPPNYPLQ
jgi:hypothetical protein